MQLKHATRQQEHEAVCMVFSVVYLRRGASAGGFLWKAPGCENRASQSGLRGCVNTGPSRASLHWTGPFQTETMSQPQEPIHGPPAGIISQMQPGKCTCYRDDGRPRLYKNMYESDPYGLLLKNLGQYTKLRPENILPFHFPLHWNL